MTFRRDLIRRFRRVWGSLFWLTLIAYFGYHAVNGERGLRRMFELRQEIKATRRIAEEVAMRRAETERKVKALSPQSLDVDMLEESARSSLNMGQDGDFVVLENVE